MKRPTILVFAMLLTTSIAYAAPSERELSSKAALVRKALRTGNVAAAAALPTQTIQVRDIEELYAAVNDPGNAGAALLLAPGVYMLSATGPSGNARANGGRLELQENMSLIGVEGDRSSVVIDAANLPASSYSTGIGTLRIGADRKSVV